MKKTYSISEVSKLLNITIDTLRFYEKKDMLHPKINPNNRYRMYDMYNILEILDIIFYRNLDMSVSDMYSIMHENNEKKALELFEKKRINCKNRIKYEQQLLKKLDYICSTMGPAISGDTSIQMKRFETSYILFKDTDMESSAQKLVLKNILSISNEEFVLGAVIKEYNTDLTEKSTYYTIEKQILEDLINEESEEEKENKLEAKVYEKDIIDGFDALSMVVPSDENKLDEKYINMIKDYAEDKNIELENYIITHEINTTAYADKRHEYKEIYIKIKK